MSKFVQKFLFFFDKKSSLLGQKIFSPLLDYKSWNFYEKKSEKKMIKKMKKKEKKKEKKKWKKKIKKNYFFYIKIFYKNKIFL